MHTRVSRSLAGYRLCLPRGGLSAATLLFVPALSSQKRHLSQNKPIRCSPPWEFRTKTVVSVCTRPWRRAKLFRSHTTATLPMRTWWHTEPPCGVPREQVQRDGLTEKILWVPGSFPLPCSMLLTRPAPFFGFYETHLYPYNKCIKSFIHASNGLFLPSTVQINITGKEGIDHNI